MAYVESRPHRRTRGRMRARRRFRNERGVAAVIGTLLSLLVFMSLFGIFLTQFLPLWMTDNEYQLANEVAQQVGQIKWCEDFLALSGSVGKVCATPVTMQSQSIPIFSQPTEATLSFHQLAQIYANISFNDTAIGGAPQPQGNFYQNLSPGDVEVQLPDRYYAPQTYSLSLGALVATQGGNQQTMMFQPTIFASSQGAATTLALTMYAMYGNSTTLTSPGTSEVYVSLLAPPVTYSATQTAVNLTMSTFYPCAWQGFFAKSLLGSGVSPLYSPALCPSSVANNQLFRMHVYFPPVTTFTLTVVSFDIEMGLGNPA